MCTRRSLHSAKSDVISRTLQVPKVPEEFLPAKYEYVCRACDTRSKTSLDPERGSFSDGSKLGGLVVGEAERRHVFVLAGKVGKSGDHYGNFGDEKGEGLTEEYEVRVAERTARLVKL